MCRFFLPVVTVPEENKNMATANATNKKNFVWSDEEVELLLQTTLNYKTSKAQQGIDWESCQSKYTDIWTSFIEQYPTPADGQPRSTAYPRIGATHRCGGWFSALSGSQRRVWSADIPVNTLPPPATHESKTPLWCLVLCTLWNSEAGVERKQPSERTPSPATHESQTPLWWLVLCTLWKSEAGVERRQYIFGTFPRNILAR